MASFHAELHLAGNRYRAVRCHYACHQATDGRGRVVAKVRHNLLHLTLDVPDSDVLLNWAATPHKPLAGQVVFYSATQLVALETIAFTAGECVGYHEQFESGASGDGAYVCQLTITAPAFELRAGGAPAAVAAVATALSSGAKTGTGAKKLAQNAIIGIGGQIGDGAAQAAAPAAPAPAAPAPAAPAPAAPAPVPVPVPAAPAALAAEAAAKAARIADVKAFQASPAGLAKRAAKAAKKQNAPEKKQQTKANVQAQEAKSLVPHQPSRTPPSGPPNPHAMPTGTPPENTPKNPKKQRDIDLENEFAQNAAKAGYQVEQNPKVPGTKNPDYRIEGQVFDCYAPNSTNLSTIREKMAGKVNGEQARRLGINLDNAPHLTVDDIRTLAHQMQQGTGNPEGDPALNAPKLEEVLVWKNGQFHHVFP